MTSIPFLIKSAIALLKHSKQIALLESKADTASIMRRQEEKSSLDFSASRQPKILTLCSSLEQKPCTFY